MTTYLVTYRIDNGPRRGRNTTAAVQAESEFDACEQIAKRPGAVVLGSTAADA